jgi:hypothetical protein
MLAGTAARAESHTLDPPAFWPVSSAANQETNQNSEVRTAQEEGSKKKARVGFLGHPPRNRSFPVLAAILLPKTSSPSEKLAAPAADCSLQQTK